MIQCFDDECTFHVPLFVCSLYVHIEKRREEIWVRRKNASDERGGTKNQKDYNIFNLIAHLSYQVSIYINVPNTAHINIKPNTTPHRIDNGIVTFCTPQ